MSGINFVGSYSGIDQSMIDQLMAAERLPLVQLSNKRVSAEEKQNAWKDINTRLNTLFEKIKVLQNQTTFTSRATSSTNKDVVTMTATKDAAIGSYKVNVEQLASNTSIISGEIDEGNIEAGTLTIGNADGVKRTISIDEGDSIKIIVDNINATTKKSDDGEGTGISATIIDGRLVLTDGKTGARNITLTNEDENGEAGQGTLRNLGLNKGVREGYKGDNAIFTVNGVRMERSSNRISDAIEGITINLNKTHEGDSYDTVNVSLDIGKMEKSIQEFVDQYNSVMSFIQSKTVSGDPDVPGSKGTLSGDSSLNQLHSSLRRMVTDKISNGNTKISDISRLGVTTVDKGGVLQFDPTVLRDALARNETLPEDSADIKDFYSIEDVMNFFSSKVGDEDVGFTSKLNGQIDSYISKDNGIVKTKTEGLDRTLKDLNKQIETFNARMERREAYYIRMFTALDVAMMQGESQMSWLQGQVDMMSASRK